MEVARWRQIAEVFDHAVGLRPEQRHQFLDNACGSDSELRSEVEKLLAADLPATEFLQPPVHANVAAQLPASVRDANIGRRVGHYELKKCIGSGGYGDVYLAARRDDLKLYVALKLIKPGQHTRDVIERFTRERELLAALRHPNIAQLIDAGTTDDNLPYFVMEYIDGKPIDEYCDEHKLPIVERLKLFQLVCAAVQFAHNNLVVHRDLKPSNILVTTDGIPKLVDFGIAKFLHPTLGPATMTLTEARPMTPAYASPEQVKGERITTATDVYSLGVVLYELLTGHRPYSLPTRLHQEMVRIICEEQPVKPSEMVSRQTTEEFLDPQSGTPRTRTITPQDVSRTRDGEPKTLRKRLAGDADNLVLYALRKEPQRRYTSAQQFEEEIARFLAGEALKEARPESQFYVLRKAAYRHRRGIAVAVVILLGLAGTVGYRARAKDSEARQRVSEISRLIALGDRKYVEKDYLEALDAYQEALKNDPGNLPVLLRCGDCLIRVGNTAKDQAATFGRVTAFTNRVLAIDPNNYDAWNQRCIASFHTGDNAGAIAACRKAGELDSTAFAPFVNAGRTYLSMGDLQNARNSFREAADRGGDRIGLMGWYNLAAIERAMGENTDESLTHALGLIKDFPEYGAERSFRVYLLRSVVRLRTGGDALDDGLQDAIAADTILGANHRHAVVKRVLALARLRDMQARPPIRTDELKKVIAAADEAVAMGNDPVPSYPHLLLAVAHALNQDVQAAQQCLATARSLWPESKADSGVLIDKSDETYYWLDLYQELEELQSEADGLLNK